MNDVAKLLQKFWLAVSGESHYFVFVTKFQEAEILRHRAVIKSKRMRKRNRSVNFHAPAETRTPHRARKIAQSVGGKQRSLFELRTIKSTRQMRNVVLDAMKLRGKGGGIGSERSGQRFANPCEFRENFHSFSRKGRHAQRVQQFCAQSRVGISRNRNVMHILQRDPRCFEAVTDRRSRESRCILHAIEAFFLDSCNQFPIAKNRRGSVAVIRIDPKNVHSSNFQCTAAEEGIRDDELSLRSCSSTPLIQDKQRPRTRPGGFAIQKRTPDRLHTFRLNKRSEQWRDGPKALFHARLERPTKPLFPRQSERALLL